MIHLLPTYYGNTTEDPYMHIKQFFEICATIKIQGLDDEQIKMRLFPFSLLDSERMMVDATSGEGLMNKTADEAFTLFESLSANSQQWSHSKGRGAPMKAVVSEVTRDPNNDPYSNTYNPGWRNHPNFKWSNNSNTQLGQIADALSQREAGKFPSQPVILQRNQEQAKAVITLRSGKVINGVGNEVTNESDHVNAGLGELKATTISLQLADRSVKYPRGIVEDILVQVDKLILPADFVVLDMEEAPIHDRELPILLGRPFMATAKTIIDVQNGLLTMTVLGETPLGPSTHLIPSVVKPPELELKPLPSHLKYAYLAEFETLPVIIASDLTSLEEDKLIRVLKEFKSTIGWSIADIKGISPTMCMHRILLEEGAKPTREPQRRLNPNMKEVLMCDASDYAIGAVLGQRVNKLAHVIYYASRTLNDAQLNYSTTEKELLARCFCFREISFISCWV
ncbi:unnamed protein product [Prunus brigantina]